MAQVTYDPDTGRFYTPTEGGGWQELERGNVPLGTAEALAVGAGRTFEQAGRGILRYGLELGNLAGADVRGELNELAAREAESERIVAGAAEEAPIAYALGRILPAVPTVTLSGGVTVQAGIAAFESGVLYQDDVADMLINTAIGAGLGGAGAALGGVIGARMARGADDAAGELRAPDPAVAERTARTLENPAETLEEVARRYPEASTIELAARMDRADRQALAQSKAEQLSADLLHLKRLDEANALGLEISPAYTYGKEWAKQLEEGLASYFPSAGQIHRIREANYEAVAGHIARAMGVPGANNLTEEVVNVAIARAAGDFEQIMGQIGTGVDVRPLAAAASNALSGTRTALQAQSVRGFARDIQRIARNMDAQPGGGTGMELMDLRSRLVDLQRDASGQLERQGFQELIQGVDDTINRALTERGLQESVEAYSDVRERWRMIRTIQKGTAVNSRGEVNWHTMRRNFKREYSRYWERDEGAVSASAARAITSVRAGAYFPQVVGNSGTPTRQNVPQALNQVGEQAAGGPGFAAAAIGALGATTGAANLLGRAATSQAAGRRARAAAVQRVTGQTAPARGGLRSLVRGQNATGQRVGGGAARVAGVLAATRGE